MVTLGLAKPGSKLQAPFGCERHLRRGGEDTWFKQAMTGAFELKVTTSANSRSVGQAGGRNAGPK